MAYLYNHLDTFSKPLLVVLLLQSSTPIVATRVVREPQRSVALCMFQTRSPGGVQDVPPPNESGRVF